jgi:hypothetical protein
MGGSHQNRLTSLRVVAVREKRDKANLHGNLPRRMAGNKKNPKQQDATLR